MSVCHTEILSAFISALRTVSNPFAEAKLQSVNKRLKKNNNEHLNILKKVFIQELLKSRSLLCSNLTPSSDLHHKQ